MKKILIGFVIFILGIIIGAIITLLSLKIDGVNEVAEDIITIKCFGQYIDYYYY